MTSIPWLTILWAIPMLGAALVIVLPASQRVTAKWLALVTSLAVLAVTLVVAVGFKPGQFPPELAAGTPVTVVVTAATATGTSTTGQGQAPGTSWRATVVGVAPAGTDQTSVVSLELDAGGASQLAQVPAGQLALVMQPAGGGR